MVKFEFKITYDDFERLALLKKEMGQADQSFNDFAAHLLHLYVNILQPQVPEENE